MAVRKIKGSWWVDFRAAHVRYRRRSPEKSKSGAESYEIVLRQKLTRGEPIDIRASRTEANQTFTEFARHWFDEYVVPNNKFSEQRAKKGILERSLIPFFGDLAVRDI